MKRRSRMAEVIAAVPTAAQAAWRMNWRRDNSRRTSTLNCFCSIIIREYWIRDSRERSSLDGEVGGIHDEVNDGAHAIAHLGESRSRIREGVGIIDDLCFGSRHQLTGAKKRVERIHQAGNPRVGGVGRGHPRA